jgi:ElaB/YqjD/DUF883 family membrane-anchored ribosome-binding protein
MKNETTTHDALLKAMSWNLADLHDELRHAGMDPDEEAEKLRSMIQSLIEKTVLQKFLSRLLQTIS